MYKKELKKLAKGLIKRGYSFSFGSLHDGWHIYCGDWDAVCHGNSYGSADELLEVTGSIVREDDNVEGWLTAKGILRRLDEKSC